MSRLTPRIPFIFPPVAAKHPPVIRFFPHIDFLGFLPLSLSIFLLTKKKKRRRESTGREWNPRVFHAAYFLIHGFSTHPPVYMWKTWMDIAIVFNYLGGKLTKSTHPHKKMPPPSGKTGSESLIHDFLEFKQLNQGRSVRTVERYSLALRRLATFMVERGGLLAATTDDLTFFSGKWLYEQGLKDPVSRKPCVAAVREFYKWAQRSGLLASDPGRAVPHPKFGRRLPRVMSLAQAEALMYAPDYSTFEGLRDATMIALLLGCGLRVSGLVDLNESNLVPVLVAGRQRLVLRTLEKGDRERQLPIPEQADLLLRLYLEHPLMQAVDRTLPSGDKVLFISTRNSFCPRHEWHGERRRINRHSVHGIVERHGKRAGLPREVTHPHALRHLYGTELAEDDVPTVTAQNLLGHVDPKTTSIYQHLAVRKLTQTVDKSNPLGKIKTPVSSLLSQLGR